jgi:hypothetical protein
MELSFNDFWQRSGLSEDRALASYCEVAQLDPRLVRAEPDRQHQIPDGWNGRDAFVLTSATELAHAHAGPAPSIPLEGRALRDAGALLRQLAAQEVAHGEAAYARGMALVSDADFAPGAEHFETALTHYRAAATHFRELLEDAANQNDPSLHIELSKALLDAALCEQNLAIPGDVHIGVTADGGVNIKESSRASTFFEAQRLAIRGLEQLDASALPRGTGKEEAAAVRDALRRDGAHQAARARTEALNFVQAITMTMMTTWHPDLLVDPMTQALRAETGLRGPDDLRQLNTALVEQQGQPFEPRDWVEAWYSLVGSIGESMGASEGELLMVFATRARAVAELQSEEN